MSTFELLTVILGCIAVLGGILAIWIKTTVAIAEINVKIVELRHDLDSKEIAILKLERDYKDAFKDNRDDHRQIIEKVDKLVDKLIK